MRRVYNGGHQRHAAAIFHRGGGGVRYELLLGGNEPVVELDAAL